MSLERTLMRRRGVWNRTRGGKGMPGDISIARDSFEQDIIRAKKTKEHNEGIGAQKDGLKQTFVGISKKYGKYYCYVSRKTLCILLERYHKIKVSERTMSRRLTELHNEGYIVRQYRNWSEVNGSKRFRCNLYILTKKLLIWVKRLGEYARQVFSFFREPETAHYSLKKPRRDLKNATRIVEILWKRGFKRWASPLNSS